MASFPQHSGVQPVRPPLVGSTGQPQNFGPPMPVQFTPISVNQETHQFIPPPSQPFQPMQGMASSYSGIRPPVPQFAPPAQQLISRPSHPSQSPVSSQTIPAPYTQSNTSISPGLMHSQQNPQLQSNPLFDVRGGGMPLFTYQPTSQVWMPGPPPVGDQTWLPPTLPVSNSLARAQGSAGPPIANPLQTAQQSSTVTTTINVQPLSTQQSSDWQEHTSSDGKRYYYNKKTKQSSWEKPLELMTPTEKADASTAWKEYSSPDGRKYYYNKFTKQSKWTIPDELKIARREAEKFVGQDDTGPSLAPSLGLPSLPLPSLTSAPNNLSSVSTSAVGTNPFSVGLVVNSVNPLNMVASSSPSTAAMPSTEAQSNSLIGTTNTPTMLNVATPVTTSPSMPSASYVVIGDAMETTATTTKVSNEMSSPSSVDNVPDEKNAQDIEEAERVTVAEKVNIVGEVVSHEEKVIVEEPLVYANKKDAKNAFKALLVSANIASDSTWEQAMRLIINDKRYGALKSLGEKKQVFNEFLDERKMQEIEDSRIKQKKARENFTKMLEESRELTSSTRWRKAEAMFEGDERFNAVERTKDREDLFESYIERLRKKEKARAIEEHKHNISEYRAFLESCDFIKASSQWRKLQDRLEVDERCCRLNKFDRLKIFQEYVNDLEKKEEEQQKILKEQLRKTERKNRDDFRKLMEEHVTAGVLTAKTHWRDYYMEVKDLPAYVAVSSNTSGATPKDLFEDVTEELVKQYDEDKALLKDAVKMGKIALTSSSTYESFKAGASEDSTLRAISEVNLKLIFKELLVKLRDKEEKEGKRRQRLADIFSNILHSAKEISASSTWKECKSLLADCQHSATDENFLREIFEKYVAHFKEKANEERKRDEEKAMKEKGREDREKKKERREKERDREKEKGKRRSRKDESDSDDVDNSSVDEKARGKDRDKKQKKHHHSAAEDVEERDEKEKSSKSHRHSSERKKSRKRDSDSDGEKRHRKQIKGRDEISRGSPGNNLEDGELGDCWRDVY